MPIRTKKYFCQAQEICKYEQPIKTFSYIEKYRSNAAEI